MGRATSGADQGWLAMDIGATKVAVRAVRGRHSADVTVAWADGPVAADLALLRDLVTRARHEAGGGFVRVGVAAAPTLDHTGTVVAWPSRPSWVGVPLAAELTRAAAAPVVIADDGSLAALAEADAVDCADLAFLGLGTGVGGGLVVGGRLVRGAFGGAGELGHLPVEWTGPRCRCGRLGCLQARLAGAAVAERAGRLRRRPTSTADLVAAVAQERRWAVRVRDEVGDLLARAVIMVSELVQPARVHLGGGLGAALPGLADRVTAALRPLARPGHPLPVVATAVLGPSASLAGALLLARAPHRAGE